MRGCVRGSVRAGPHFASPCVRVTVFKIDILDSRHLLNRLDIRDLFDILAKIEILDRLEIFDTIGGAGVWVNFSMVRACG